MKKLHSEVSAVALNGNTDLNVADAATLQIVVSIKTQPGILSTTAIVWEVLYSFQLLEIKQLDSLDWQLLSSCVFY